MDLAAYRKGKREQARTADLVRLIPDNCRRAALDIGARDGWFSAILAERFQRVTAVDLTISPSQEFPAPRIQADLRALPVRDESQEFVLCAEVLEHIASPGLEQACAELTRVASRYLLIGVPFKQDLRALRTTCGECHRPNPSFGHVNRFDEHRLRRQFPRFRVLETSFVETDRLCSNFLSARLLDFAGNPYGTYYQGEPCIYCGAKLVQPTSRTFLQRVATRSGKDLVKLQSRFHWTHPRWIHMLYEKLPSPRPAGVREEDAAPAQVG